MRNRLEGLAAAALLAVSTASAAPIRALIFSGRNNHDWRTTTPFLSKLLADTGRFDVRVEEEPAGTSAATLAPYDVLILDYNGARWGEATERAVEAFLSGGKGLVAVHGASYAFGGLEILGDRHVRTGIVEPPWPQYAAMLGASWSEAPPKSGHAPRHLFTVTFTGRSHPITAGLPESFSTYDELYHNLRLRPGIRILATAFDDPKNGGTAKDEPVMWTLGYGSGRVFHTVLGHDVAAMQEPGFGATFVRGAEWAATGAVTLPAQRPRPADAIRVQVVTGGHDHDASFYSLFEGQPDIAATIKPHPDAYNSDLRKSVDVLVLYDMVQEVGERPRKNLQDFVEGGKGLVVLHHAIADFNNWPWWYEQVVGGRYLLKPDAGRPASTYRHDEEVFAQAAATHPIVAGIGALHLRDETYKGLWISPKVTVLLRTGNPTSDGPVAWVSPYDKSRVVYIQLGHDRWAHDNPAYHQLVRQAILWAAGRL